MLKAARKAAAAAGYAAAAILILGTLVFVTGIIGMFAVALLILLLA